MEKKKLQNIDAQFQESFDGFRAKPADMVWLGLEAQLLDQKAEKQRGRRMKIAFALLLTIFLLSLGYTIMAGHFAIDQVPTENDTQAIPSKTAPQAIIDSPEVNTKTIETEFVQVPNTESDLAQQAAIAKKKIQQLPVKMWDNQVELNTFSSNITTGSDELEETLVLSPEEEGITIPLPLPTKLTALTFGLHEEPFLPSSSGEVDDKKLSFWKRFSLAPWVSVDLSGRRLKNNDQYGSSTQNLEFFEQRESRGKGWTSGVRLSFDLGKNWRLHTGVGMQNLVMEIGGYDLKAVYKNNEASNAILFTSYNTNEIEFELRDMGGLEEGELFTALMDLEQQIRFVNIPLALSYEIGKRRMGLELSTGLNANFPMKSELKLQSGEQEVTNFRHVFAEDSGQFFFGYFGSLDIKYRLKKQFTLLAGPQFSGAIQPANQQKPMKFLPQSWGARIGIERQF